MPLKKLIFKPGVNRENTRYTTEGGWYDCDKIRFRQGTPEKIGGWQQLAASTFLGTCRSLWSWSTLGGVPYIGVGTNLKYYVYYDGAYNDITPIRDTVTLVNPFQTAVGSTTVVVTDTAHGCLTGDYVTFSGATPVAGVSISGPYQITRVNSNTYTITAAVAAFATATGGGAAVTAAYEVNTGYATPTLISGWGAAAWSSGPWGQGASALTEIRVWNAQNFGEDLLYGPRGGPLYYWDASAGLTTRGTAVSGLSGASDVPLFQNLMLVSDASRFVLVFGTNDYGSLFLDKMLIRWSDQESAVNWTPAATNQAGSLRLSHGSEISAVAQVRQEIMVWTDTSLYSLQYLGPPIVWGSQLLSDNTSIISDRAWATAANVTYWMGKEKFYAYAGTVATLPCDLRQYVFGDFNMTQAQQVFASTIEQFNEVWWFYCSANSSSIDRYVVYNYLEKVWYYGNMSRTAWIDVSASTDHPVAANGGRLLLHEIGTDDNATGTPAPISAYITSSEVDIDDGHNFGFIWRVVPDITFRGSSAASPSATMTLLPLRNSGSGYTSPASVAGTNAAAITRTATIPIEAFTGQVYTRIRGRQIAIKIESTALGVQWQLGAPRIDIRQDGRR